MHRGKRTISLLILEVDHALQSQLFRGDPKLEAAAVSDPAFGLDEGIPGGGVSIAPFLFGPNNPMILTATFDNPDKRLCQNL
jgi:hypothetical protein